ncbi:MAG: hypothetical protein GQ565_07325 [Candidatus Aegiribacteria sp.]|nr:hypothetical protein [Candidatus Aegiribacteria sp.]
MNSILMDLLEKALVSGIVSSVMVPSRGPDNSFPWTLVTDVSALNRVEPVPPVMSVHGAKALASFTQSMPEGKLLAVMRPCEARAAIELSKLEQIDLGNIILLTMDCPGAVPLKEYGEDGTMEPDINRPETLRPLCRQCTEFTSAGDLCLAMHGGLRTVIPLTSGGQELLDSLGMKAESDTSQWKEWANALRGEREKVRAESTEKLKETYSGLQGLVEVFSGCISCRSCRTVCPICYCRLCFIDMKDRRSPASAHLERSRNSGAARLMSNTLLFHIGRMAHMSLSCVSCGMCEDACPSDIPTGRLVSMVSGNTTELFSYSAGRNPEDPLPLNTYQLEELHEYED